MGLLRFLLAFAVFNAHAGLPLGMSLLAGSTAVHCFFVISGFYMAMVLTQKYASAGYGDFITSRMLRLMPSYMVVAGVTLICAGWLRAAGIGELKPLATHTALAAAGLPAWLQGLSLVSQLTLVGHDAFSFVTWSADTGLAWVTPAQGVEASLQDLMLVPPAWSLSVEIYFYLLAPFVVGRRLVVLWALLALSLSCRLLLLAVFDCRVDPWSYRFFPSELLYFLAGVFSFRLGQSARLVPGIWMLMLASVGALLGLVEILGIYQPGMAGHKWARVPLFALLCAGMPLLFNWTRDWRWDRAIGELSYPLYICHFLVIWLISAFTGDLHSPGARLALIGCAMLVAIALRRWIDVPVDHYRQQRLRRAAVAAGAVSA